MSLLLVGVISLFLGQDYNWDLRNYHYYSGYAFLNNRIDKDFMPAGHESYFNPLIDVMNYVFIKFFPPRLTSFALGVIQGFNLWLLAIICGQFINLENNYQKYLLIVIISFLGIYSANVIGEVGTTFNDLTLSSLVLLAVFLITTSLKSELSSTKEMALVFAAGISIGLATGFKLTFSIYALAMVMAFFVLRKPYSNKFKLASFFVAGCIIGFIISNGFWMIILWKHFHNPFFPLFNEFLAQNISLI